MCLVPTDNMILKKICQKDCLIDSNLTYYHVRNDCSMYPIILEVWSKTIFILQAMYTTMWLEIYCWLASSHMFRWKLDSRIKQCFFLEWSRRETANVLNRFVSWFLFLVFWLSFVAALTLLNGIIFIIVVYSIHKALRLLHKAKSAPFLTRNSLIEIHVVYIPNVQSRN